MDGFDVVLQRLIATREAQVQLAEKWVWEEKALVQWDQMLGMLRQLHEAVSGLDAEYSGVRGSLQESLGVLHEKTKLTIGLAKVRYRNDGAKLRLFANLTATQGSVAKVLGAAAELSSAWAQVDRNWSPVVGLSLQSFDTLREGCEQLSDQQERTKAELREKQAQLGAALKEADSTTKAWYAVATRIYGAKTLEGSLVRRLVPTSYRKVTKKKETKVTPELTEATE